MIYPTRRAVMLTAAGAPVALALGLAQPGWWLAGAAWVLFVLGLIGVDALLGAGRDRLELQAEAPGVMGVGRAEEAQVRAVFDGRAKPRTLELALEAAQRLVVTPERLTARVREGEARAQFTLTPVRRGEGPIERLWARWTGPLGLVWKQRSQPLEKLVRVTPDIAAVKAEAIRMYARDAVFGVRAQLDQGDGSEFQSLREFQQGMDRRAIDWKQSARHRQLLAKEFRTERNHPMIFALDTGRLMCEPVAGLPRIDHAINASLLLAYVALKTGDRPGFFAFDSKPRLMTGTVSGVGAFPVLQRMAAAIDYSTEEANFTLGLTQLSGALERRTLIVVFTDFADATSAELMIENLARLMKRHLVMFVVFRDEELQGLADVDPQTPEDVSRAVIADELLKEREVVTVRLKRMGALIVETPVDRLGPELVSRYLDLKRRELL